MGEETKYMYYNRLQQQIDKTARHPGYLDNCGRHECQGGIRQKMVRSMYETTRCSRET